VINMSIKKIITITIFMILFIPFIVNAESKYLYDVLKDEAESGGLAKEYTGEHHDSFTEEPSKKIYHWYAANDTQGNQVLEKNNVIFANHCWQMIRTTDTGGVKMIYNGELEDGKCLNTRSNHVGYIARTTQTLNPTFYYGTSYTYDKNNNVFSLSGTVTTGTINTGEYTCKSTSSNGTCATLYLVDTLSSGSTYYVLPLNGNSHYSQFGALQFNQQYDSLADVGYMYNTRYIYDFKNQSTHDLRNYNNTYTYGDSYTDNGNGTYTIDNATTINRSDWYTNYSNIGAKKYVCNNAVNNTCSELWYTTSISKTSMTYIKVADVYKYAKGFTWDGDKYVLDNNTSVTFWNINDSINKNSINNAHYTCWNETGECESISYIYGMTSYAPFTIYYINLTDGKSITDMVDEMLYNDNVNRTNSTIKNGVDAWYKQYLLNYSDYLEDTIFCNNRSQNNFSKNGWNPNGGSISTPMSFKENNERSDLSCPNETDQFCINNNKARLIYSIGLMSSSEIFLSNNNKVRATGKSYWLMSPENFPYRNAIGYCNGTTGDVTSVILGGTFGVRPAISLKSSARVVSGNGSTSDPYQLSFNPIYSVNVEIKNETKDLDINIEDMSQVEEGEEVTFKVTPITGYKVNSIQILDSDNHEVTFTETGVENQYSFTMPNKNVTIIPSYKKNRFNVSVTVKNEEKDFDINVEDMTSVLVGEEVTFKVTPITGYKVNSIEILDSDNNEVTFTSTSNENKYTFTMPESDITIIPSYERVSNSIEVEKNTHTKELTIEVNDISAVVYEDEVKFTIIPEKGYEVDSIDIKDQDNNSIDYQKTDNDNEYSFIMPPSNVTIKPTYKKVSNSVNIDDNKNTKEFIIEVNDSKAVVYEDTVKFTIIPEDGYELEDIEILDKNNNKIEYKKTSKDNEYIFTMPETDVIIKPIYRKLPIKENNNIINPLTNNNLTKILLIVILFFTTGLFLYRKKGLSIN